MSMNSCIQQNNHYIMKHLFFFVKNPSVTRIPIKCVHTLVWFSRAHNSLNLENLIIEINEFQLSVNFPVHE